MNLTSNNNNGPAAIMGQTTSSYSGGGGAASTHNNGGLSNSNINSHNPLVSVGMGIAANNNTNFSNTVATNAMQNPPSSHMST